MKLSFLPFYVIILRLLFHCVDILEVDSWALPELFLIVESCLVVDICEDMKAGVSDSSILVTVPLH